jgi:hypothetical protein
MVAFVVPVGHLLGPSYSERGAAGPDSYDVRIGGDFCYLDHRAYTVWLLAHGFPEAVEKRAPSRAQISEQAVAQGITEPDAAFGELLDQGLLVQVLPTQSQLRGFAESHRAYAAGYGLGNTAQDPASYAIGTPDDPWALVEYRTYFIWSGLSRAASLWDALDQIADYQVLRGEDGVPLTTDGILAAFTEQLPMLLATNCVYLDRRA